MIEEVFKRKISIKRKPLLWGSGCFLFSHGEYLLQDPDILICYNSITYKDAINLATVPRKA
jgi:hypothetical protein